MWFCFCLPGHTSKPSPVQSWRCPVSLQCQHFWCGGKLRTCSNSGKPKWRAKYSVQGTYSYSCVLSMEMLLALSISLALYSIEIYEILIYFSSFSISFWYTFPGLFDFSRVSDRCLCWCLLGKEVGKHLKETSVSESSQCLCFVFNRAVSTTILWKICKNGSISCKESWCKVE